MSLPLTPHTLAGAYDYLRTTPPFKGWRLPPAEEVEFAVTRHRDREGDYGMCGRTEHVIRVSMYKIKTTDMLLQVIAHEMIHEYQEGKLHNGSGRTDHNKVFWALAYRVCRAHGWDATRFVG